MASAFRHTFWWALGLLLVALVFSAALPKRQPLLAAGGVAAAGRFVG